MGGEDAEVLVLDVEATLDDVEVLRAELGVCV